MPIPTASLNWDLVTTAPAMSPVHVDAGKFATFIWVHTGTKLWFIRDTPSGGTSFDKPVNETNPLKHQWTGVLLKPGHSL